eukprot:jgi/Tetstr1/462466/TSEL_007462.t1
MNLGCLRRATAEALTYEYRVSSSGAVPHTELRAVRVLFDAELGCRYDRNFHPTPYSGRNSAFKAACASALPDPATQSAPMGHVGIHSGRKSFAKGLWDRCRSARVIAHVMQWVCRQDALDAYFKTSATENLRPIAALYLLLTDQWGCSGVFTDTAVTQWHDISYTPL